MYTKENNIIKLVGRFTGISFYDEDKYQELSYCFDTLTLSDCKNGEIRGCELMDKTIFKTNSDCSLSITAYELNEVDLKKCTKKELEILKYSRLNKREQRFLNFLNRGEIITFWARISNTIWQDPYTWDDPYTTYSCSCAWDFKRCKNKKIAANLESLLGDIGIYTYERKGGNFYGQ